MYTDLSLRERMLVVATVIVIGLLGMYSVGEALLVQFSTRTEEVVEDRRELDSLKILLERHAQLETRRKAIESKFSKSDSDEKTESLSYIESLIAKHFGTENKFNINALATRPFGERFVQRPFAVRLATDKLQDIVNFLYAVTYGKHPLIVTRLQLTVSRTQDNVDVEAEVSVVETKTGPAT